ncbi:unnamed protein product [Diabrotica balteata]|uniref:BED-type domain-containing protein n=1 Tax=Diabrotica balteata TaxID=107213 RepID=A0A9N9SQS1_DIABA|nr:unnamed protein product [Diabrotica balteata]
MDKFLISTKRKSNVSDRPESEESDQGSSSTSVSSTPQRKRQKMSLVWNYFTKSLLDKKFAKCCTCGREYKTSGNTTNLTDHLKRFHPNLNKPLLETSGEDEIGKENYARSNVRSISPFFRREQEYDANSQRKKELDKALAMMLATDFQPFSIVKDSGFIKFVQLLDPRYVLPSPDTLKNTVLKNLYDDGVKKLTTILNEIKYVGLTTDIWTSSANESYICLTCHFINKDWEIKKAVLKTKVMDTNNTSENIADCIRKILDEYKISDKVSCIVTDNAANMIKACDLLRKKHLPCFSHTLNLVVQDNLKKPITADVLKKCKEVVTYFKSSCVAYKKYIEEQNQLWKGTTNEGKTPYKFLQEVPTRWNSVYYMIKRILLISDAINNTLLKQRNAPGPFSVDELSVLGDLEKILYIFEDATEKVSGEKYITVSLIVPLAFGIYNYLTSLQLNTEIGQEFYTGVIDSVRRRLFNFETRSIPKITALLDPRFKKDGFRTTENANQAANLLEEEMAAIISGNRKNTQEENVPNNSSSSTVTSSSSVIFNFLDKKNKDKATNVKADAIIQKRQYLERPNLSGDTDPLLFWKVNGREFEPMQELVQKYYCIPGSSVESERNFSTAGLILNDRRSRLKSKLSLQPSKFVTQFTANKWSGDQDIHKDTLKPNSGHNQKALPTVTLQRLDTTIEKVVLNPDKQIRYNKRTE